MLPPNLAESSAVVAPVSVTRGEGPTMAAGDAPPPESLPKEPAVVAKPPPVVRLEFRDRLVRVRPGASLFSLVREVYGTEDIKHVRRVLAANPQVWNPHHIFVGEVLRFPKAPTQTATAPGSVSNE